MRYCIFHMLNLEGGAINFCLLHVSRFQCNLKDEGRKFSHSQRDPAFFSRGLKFININKSSI